MQKIVKIRLNDHSEFTLPDGFKVNCVLFGDSYNLVLLLEPLPITGAIIADACATPGLGSGTIGALSEPTGRV